VKLADEVGEAEVGDLTGDAVGAAARRDDREIVAGGEPGQDGEGVGQQRVVRQEVVVFDRLDPARADPSGLGRVDTAGDERLDQRRAVASVLPHGVEIERGGEAAGGRGGDEGSLLTRAAVDDRTVEV